MEDITAILIHYREQPALVKALGSLKQLGERLISIIIFQEKQLILDHLYGNDRRIRFIPIDHEDLGKIINDTVSSLTSSYVLFLSNPAYLASNIDNVVLDFSQSNRLLGTSIEYWNRSLRHPVMVPRSFLLEHPLLLRSQLPFKEALLPAWLSKADSDTWEWKEGLIKHSQANRSPNTMQKSNFLYKYQLPNEIITSYPSVSVMIATFNMDSYLETAIRSCFLQTEQPEKVLVIDDGSTDQSPEILHHWDKEKKVKVFNKRNGGKARAFNALLPHVTTDFVFELDADDWLDPDAIKTVKTYLADLPKDVSLLYGNLRKWKQLEEEGNVFYKTTAQGMPVNDWTQLLHYPFPLGPRVYRTSLLKRHGGFPVLEFADGRLYEDVSVLRRLIDDTQFCYRDFTVYNVREHKQSITKQEQATWDDFIKAWKDEEKNDRG